MPGAWHGQVNCKALAKPAPLMGIDRDRPDFAWLRMYAGPLWGMFLL